MNGTLLVSMAALIEEATIDAVFDKQHETLSGTGLIDRKSTRLNSSHGYISYAVFCLKKKKETNKNKKKKKTITGFNSPANHLETYADTAAATDQKQHYNGCSHRRRATLC